jgi:DNA-binding MarR family transcriptional regulator
VGKQSSVASPPSRDALPAARASSSRQSSPEISPNEGGRRDLAEARDGRRERTQAGRHPPAQRQAPAAARPAAPARSAQPRALNLDRLIHERLRLGIVSALAVNECLSFTDLKRLLDTTDGNLSVHARKLEDAQYIACDKSFDGRVPRTEYRLTAAGRRALDKYLVHMEALIKAVRD